jgi:hypothetical protein
MKKILTTAASLEIARDTGPCAIIRVETDTSLRGAALFENLGAAKYALQVFLNINGKMDDSIQAVESQPSAEVLKSFKRGASRVMYEVFERTVEPICKRHPSLRPPEMEG